MTIHKIHPPPPDMQAIEAQAEQKIESLEVFLDTLDLVDNVDGVFLQSAKNNLFALKETLRLAMRVRG